MQADTGDSLDEIQIRTSSPIASTLLDLQEHEIIKDLSSHWIEKLDIIYPSAYNGSRKQHEIKYGKTLLSRMHINALDRDEKYIALSYTCQPPQNQRSSYGAYLVRSRDGSFKDSQVRDQVFHRVIAYQNYLDVPIWGFWIDQECINQADEEEKQLAIQTMEKVYAQSAFPVALLSTWIESEDHLEDLIYILEKKNPLRSQKEHRITSILDLLIHITSDPWWKRGWTFQEDYCASIRMDLLIPHSSSLTQLKERNKKLLGNLEGELCIRSTNFRSRATEFCMVYQKDRRFKNKCDKILDKAGKYTVQLQELDGDGNPTIRQSMSPTIFSNVGKRDIGVESDRLAVIANCLGYPIRLNTQKVNRRECSLSIAMLALFLLNGEILMNGPCNSQNTLKSNIFDYLKEQSLHTFQTPDIDKKLTFIKHCRFPSVELFEGGILTSGHLWRLTKIIKDARKTPPPHKGPDYHLNGYQRMRLSQLVEHLYSGGWDTAESLDGYLYQDEMWEDEDITFSKFYKDLMAEEVVQAMDDRYSCRLRLGSLMSRRHTGSGRGIFISEAGHPWKKETAYVFTAVCPREKSIDKLDKYVSLEVELLGWSEEGPRLIIKRWVNGLFFFDKCSPIDVVFPWPKSLV